MPIYLKFRLIDGESNIEGYKGQFLLNSVSCNGTVTQTDRTKKAEFTSITVSKSATIHSPTIMLYMASQAKLGTIVITVTQRGEYGDFPIDVYTLENTVLATFSQSSDSGYFTSEDLVFVFSKATLTQFTYNSNDERTGESTHYWDVGAKAGG
jgi:type VI protein secretion system component Hcp